MNRHATVARLDIGNFAPARLAGRHLARRESLPAGPFY